MKYTVESVKAVMNGLNSFQVMQEVLNELDVKQTNMVMNQLAKHSKVSIVNNNGVQVMYIAKEESQLLTLWLVVKLMLCLTVLANIEAYTYVLQMELY